jgi:hypothetical protein
VSTDSQSAPPGGFRKNIRPRSGPGDKLVAEYDAVYAEISSKMLVERKALQSVIEKLAEEFAPHCEASRIRHGELIAKFTPFFNAKVREKFDQDKPKSVECPA